MNCFFVYLTSFLTFFLPYTSFFSDLLPYLFTSYDVIRYDIYVRPKADEMASLSSARHRNKKWRKSEKKTIIYFFQNRSVPLPGRRS